MTWLCLGLVIYSLYSLDNSFFVFLISNNSSVSTEGCRLLLIILILNWLILIENTEDTGQSQ